jgi:hypothetical protein
MFLFFLREGFIINDQPPSAKLSQTGLWTKEMLKNKIY